MGLIQENECFPIIFITPQNSIIFKNILTVVSSYLPAVVVQQSKNLHSFNFGEVITYNFFSSEDKSYKRYSVPLTSMLTLSLFSLM